MNFWWKIFLGRALAWAALGGFACALVGMLCGIGFILCPSLDALFSVPTAAGTQDNSDLIGLVCIVAAYFGFVIGGAAGSLAFCVMSFFCSTERKTIRIPLRFVIVGMVLGTVASRLWLEASPWILSFSGGTPPRDLAIFLGPSFMVLGLVAGAIYTVLVPERRHNRAELTRWGRIIESDYDVFLPSKARP